MREAEANINAVEKQTFTRETLGLYNKLFEKSGAKKKIYEGRNFAQALSKRGLAKLIHLAAQYLSKGRGFIDKMPIEPDYKTLKPVKESNDNVRPSPEKKTIDGVLYVDKLTGVYLSKTIHREDQPSHIIVHDRDLCVNECFKIYRFPCTRF